jgi:acyl-CoA synthetase (AMP-forming)/AMP-acid ligase II
MPSPVTHITGYLYALELPFALGVSVILMDRWEVTKAVRLVERFGVTFSIGATPFLVELISEVERLGLNLSSLRLYVSGGAPILPEIVRRARRVLPNCQTVRAYGCSEAPTISLGVRQGDSMEFGAITDGYVYNHEVRIVDDASGEILNGRSLEGEILVRGPEVMLGYTNSQHTIDAFDGEGFFRTGDLGRLDEHGYITISGRKKDLIIRGGENISAKEIEDVLHRNPAVQEATVVAMPHSRLGETPCAFVILRQGAHLEFHEMKEFLEHAMLARQKIPERLFVVQDLPRTASGKVLKHVLRARVELDISGALGTQ